MEVAIGVSIDGVSRRNPLPDRNGECIFESALSFLKEEDPKKQTIGFDLLKELADGKIPCEQDIQSESSYLFACSVKQNDTLVFDYLKIAADLGHAPAANEVGKMYAAGCGVTQNYEQAALYFMLAVNRGPIPGACCELSQMYANGQGVVKSADLAREIFKVAFLLKSFNDNCGVFFAYADGICEQKNDPDADFILYKLNMTLCRDLYKNNPAYIDPDKIDSAYTNPVHFAIRYLKNAAEAGHPEALFVLGLGLMVNQLPENLTDQSKDARYIRPRFECLFLHQNIDQATIFLHTAAEKGHEKALFLLKKLNLNADEAVHRSHANLKERVVQFGRTRNK